MSVAERRAAVDGGAKPVLPLLHGRICGDTPVRRLRQLRDVWAIGSSLAARKFIPVTFDRSGVDSSDST
jgi:hypothetical protein